MSAGVALAAAASPFTSASAAQSPRTQMRAALNDAVQRRDIPAMIACRDDARSVRVITDAERLDAEEIMRRADRAIGVAIRRGQADGTIRRSGRHRPETAGTPSATDYISKNELYPGGNGRSTGLYQLTDGVTDEAFEAALAAARAEGSLSRVAVGRHLLAAQVPADTDGPHPGDRSFAAIGQRLDVLRVMANDGCTSHQIGDRLGRSPHYVRELARREGIVISGDETTGKRRPNDSRRIVDETAATLEGLAMGLRSADLSDLDPALIQGWAASLARSLPVLTRLKRELTRKATQ